MKKNIIIVLLLFVLTSLRLFSQCTLFFEYKNNTDTTIFLKSESFWIYPTPFGYVSKMFSPDNGKTWENVGILGQNIRPYVLDNANAIKNLNTYRTIRIVGLGQIFIIAPIFLYLNELDNNRRWELSKKTGHYESSNLVWGSVVCLYTGEITYFLISNIFLKKTLREYYNSNKITLNSIIPNMSIGYNPTDKVSSIKLNWNF